MKNKILSIALCAAGALGMTACSDDYFETKSYSEANADFVF
jgi:hypothetical protein